LILEKIPFFALSLWVGWLTLAAQAQVGATELPRHWGPFQRLLLASYGIVMYVVKLFWPFRLSATYPYPDSLSWGFAPVFFLALPVVLLAVAALLRYGRGNRPLIFGAVFFFINIVLVLQFFTVGHVTMADRYTYVPYLGLTLPLTWWLDDRRQPRGRTFRTALAAVVAAVVAISLWQTPVRCKVWKNSETLWSDVIAKYPSGFLAYVSRGQYNSRSGQLDRALADYNRALALNPNMVEALTNRGTVLARMGDYTGAMRDFDAAIRTNPRYAQAYKNRGVALSQLKRYEEAIADFRKLLELTPGDAAITSEIGVSYLRLDRPQEALAEFNRAIALAPNSGLVYFNRSVAWERLGDRARALDDARRAQSLGVSGDDPGRIERLSR
jgi:Tfp pilus assembly protein PilF